MSNDDQLDDQLRRMANRSQQARASAVDVNTAHDEHRSRLTDPNASGHGPRRWLVGAAAVFVVVAGIAAIAWPRGGGPDTVATQTDTSSPSSSATAPSSPQASNTVSATTEQTTVPAADVPSNTATASPTVVGVGGTVVITPADTVTPSCNFVVTLISAADRTQIVGQILSDTWIPASTDTPVTYPACLETMSGESVTVTVPDAVPGGEYLMCIAGPSNSAGCASVTIEPATTGRASCESDPLTPPSLVDGSQPGEPVIEAQGSSQLVRWGSPDTPFPVTQSLGSPIDATWIDDAITAERAISEGDWQAATVPVGDPPLGQISIYLRNTSDDCLRVYNIGPGLYSDEAVSLAQDWVAALATRESIEAPGHDAIAFGYFGRRFESTRFRIDEFDATGAVVGTVPDDQMAALFQPHTLADGTTVRLDGNRSGSRCTNQPIVRSGGSNSGAVDLGVSEARSIAVTDDGIVLATRDICPTGTRWGDPDTYSELIAIDPAPEQASVVVLQTWPSDADQIVFEDESQVFALGERTIADVSPNGRYLSVRELYASDASRWILLDLSDNSATLTPASACDDAGDIVGPPRFVSDDVLVIARLCEPLNAGDDSAGEGDVQVEAVDLATQQPGGRIVWNASVAGLGVDEFTRSVELGARQTPSGTIWALVSGNGGLETSSQTFALHDSEVTEITRRGYHKFAFDPADLITEFDTPPN